MAIMAILLLHGCYEHHLRRYASRDTRESSLSLGKLRVRLGIGTEKWQGRLGVPSPPPGGSLLTY